MNNKLEIPPKCHNHRGRPKNPNSLSSRLRKLGVGDHIEIPREQEKQLTSSANSAGIKVTQRRMGAEDITTVWRVADEEC